MKKAKKAWSMILAVALVITMLPRTAPVTKAAEPTSRIVDTLIPDMGVDPEHPSIVIGTDYYDMCSSGMMILLGAWADEGTRTLKAVIDRREAQPGEVVWEVVKDYDAAYGFHNPCVMVDEYSGMVTVLGSGIVKVRCTATADSSKSFYIVVIVPGDYNRDGEVNRVDAQAVYEVWQGAPLDDRAYSMEMGDVEEDGMILEGDPALINRIVDNEEKISVVAHLATFDACGGNVSPTTKLVIEDKTYGTLPVPYRRGYRFDGWYTAAEGGSAVTEETVVTATENDTLYAHWTRVLPLNFYSDIYSFTNSRIYFHDTYRVSLPVLQTLVDHIQKNVNGTKRAFYIAEIVRRSSSQWSGSCYGIAITTALNKLGKVDVPENFDLQANGDIRAMRSPRENSGTEDVINYYQLSQYLPFIKGSAYSVGSQNADQAISNAIRAVQDNQLVAFCYSWSWEKERFGHAILLYDYQQREDGTRCFTAYDNRDSGGPVTVTFSNDYSSCQIYSSWGGKLETPDKIQTQTDFSVFDCIDIDGPNNDMVIPASGGNAAIAATADEGTATLSVSAAGTFTMTNTAGETLTYSNGNISGTMEILDQYDVIRDNADGTPAPMTLEFVVNNSDSFTYTTADTDSEFSVLSSDVYGDVLATNADKITISSAKGIDVEGKNLTYDVALSTDMGSCNMVALSGTTADGMTLAQEGDRLIATGLTGDVELTSYADNTYGNTNTITAPASGSVSIVDNPNDSTGQVLVEEIGGVNTIEPVVEADSNAGLTLVEDPYGEGGKMLILRGAWAEESTYTLQAKINGAKAEVGAVIWKIVDGCYNQSSERGGYGFVNSDLSDQDIVTVDAGSGILTVKNSGIVKVQCTSTVDPSKSFFVTVVVPGDYDRDGEVTGEDADNAMTIYFAPENLSKVPYAKELLDMDRDGEVTGEDADIVMSVFFGIKTI